MGKRARIQMAAPQPRTSARIRFHPGLAPRPRLIGHDFPRGDLDSVDHLAQKFGDLSVAWCKWDNGVPKVIPHQMPPGAVSVNFRFRAGGAPRPRMSVGARCRCPVRAGLRFNVLRRRPWGRGRLWWWWEAYVLTFRGVAARGGLRFDVSRRGCARRATFLRFAAMWLRPATAAW